MKKYLIVFLILIFTCPAWAATDYYVKNGGNDESAGTSDETAWATVAKVTATATSGDTVYFRSQDTWTAASGAQVLEATAGVIYDGKTYGSGTRATFKGAADVTNGYKRGVVLIDKSNVTLRGFDIDVDNYRADGITIGYNTATAISNILIDDVLVHDNGPATYVAPEYFGYGLLIASSTNPGIGTVISNVTIQNSEFYNNGGESIALYQSRIYPNNRTNGVLIRNCIMRDNGLADANKFGTGLTIANDSDNVTVEFCTIYNSQIGIWIRTSPLYEIEAGNGAPNNMIIRYNLIYNSHVYGISIDNPQGANTTTPLSMSGDFYGNIIMNSGGDLSIPYYKNGWDLSVGAYNWNTSVFNFHNNTFYNSVNVMTNTAGVVNFGRIGEAAGWGGTPTINFKNNIIATSGTFSYGDFALLWDEGGITHNNNLYYRSSGATHHHIYANSQFYDRDGTASDLTNWEATAQKTAPAFIGNTLPTGFTGTYGTNMVPNTDYFQLTVDSPAKDAGATLASYTGAINGAGLAVPIVRPLGDAFDIGAYEYGTVAQSGGSAGSGFKIQGVTIR